MKRFYLVLILFAVTGGSALGAIPSYQEVRDAYKKSDAILLDRHKEVIHELRIDKNGRRLDWVSLKEISPAMQLAIIYAEDRRFYTHRGVDWRAMGAGFIKTLTSRSPRGASTITMQLASILNRELQAKRYKRSLQQKWRQIQGSWEIERRWQKQEILEAYLNLVTFRGEL